MTTTTTRYTPVSQNEPETPVSQNEPEDITPYKNEDVTFYETVSYIAKLPIQTLGIVFGSVLYGIGLMGIPLFKAALYIPASLFGAIGYIAGIFANIITGQPDEYTNRSIIIGKMIANLPILLPVGLGFIGASMIISGIGADKNAASFKYDKLTRHLNNTLTETFSGDRYDNNNLIKHPEIINVQKKTLLLPSSTLKEPSSHNKRKIDSISPEEPLPKKRKTASTPLHKKIVPTSNTNTEPVEILSAKEKAKLLKESESQLEKVKAKSLTDSGLKIKQLCGDLCHPHSFEKMISKESNASEERLIFIKNQLTILNDLIKTISILILQHGKLNVSISATETNKFYLRAISRYHERHKEKFSELDNKEIEILINEIIDAAVDPLPEKETLKEPTSNWFSGFGW